jgi:uridine phosphorylase
MADDTPAPLLRAKAHAAPSVFTPENLLRESRRQKRVAAAAVPEICVLDPDGDIVRHLVSAGQARQDSAWACYHTALYVFARDGLGYGIVGGVVGAPFAVLVAEELFASGCRLLLSVTSAGQIVPVGPPPYFVLIERALRDEGTSYHYAPPSDYSFADPSLIAMARAALAAAGLAVPTGAVWTTDAPFRETAEAIERARQAGLFAVEMEAAALYAFAAARRRAVLCLAHVTNQMASIEGDFEKGVADGAEASLQMLTVIACRWRNDADVLR